MMTESNKKTKRTAINLCFFGTWNLQL